MTATRRDHKVRRRSEPMVEPSRPRSLCPPATAVPSPRLASHVEVGTNEALPMYMIKGQRVHHGVFMSESHSALRRLAVNRLHGDHTTLFTGSTSNSGVTSAGTSHGQSPVFFTLVSDPIIGKLPTTPPGSSRPTGSNSTPQAPPTTNPVSVLPPKPHGSRRVRADLLHPDHHTE